MTAVELAPNPEIGMLERLAACGAVLGSLAILSACGANHPNTNADPHNTPPHGSLGNPYHNGDIITVTPGLTAKVVEGGGRVLFSLAALNHFLHTHPNTEVDIDMHNQHGNYQHIQIADGQALEIPNPYVEEQLLECNPPAYEPKDCEITVERLIARNTLLPGDPKVHKSPDGIYRWPFKGSPSDIFIEPNRRPV
jgi:hypothetical protein